MHDGGSSGCSGDSSSWWRIRGLRAANRLLHGDDDDETELEESDLSGLLQR
jgi:hypothetical protein